MATSATVRAGSVRQGAAQRPLSQRPLSQRALTQRAAVACVERAIRATVRPPRSRYLEEYAEAFQSYTRRLSGAELLGRAAQADVILIGDYHSLVSCQEFATEFLRRISGRDGRGTVLGLEAVYSADQPVLDEWVRGGVAEDELRHGLCFDNEWGYDWEPYRGLFRVARRECESVWGLDSEPRFDLRRVRARDRHMAERILAMRSQCPKARTVVFVGESHLAPCHLPQLLRDAGERVFTILQNVDALYWQWKSGDAAAPPPVALTKDVACVFNASPLEKYQSYWECLERWLE